MTEFEPDHSKIPSRFGALWAILHVAAMALFVLLGASRVSAAGAITEGQAADLAMGAFADTCTIRGITANEAEARMRDYVARNGGMDLPFALEFYDTTLNPTDLTVTPGTDRRCAVSFGGNYAREAAMALVQMMERPPVFGTWIPTPITHSATHGTFFIEGRQLTPNVAAVVHVGVRDTASGGLETFMNVERLVPAPTQ
ncbi:MAG: hypothetical protein AAF376_16010 [Pseudomonadota bacterium]